MSASRFSVKISSEAKNNLKILSKRNGKSELDYLSNSIIFLYKTGIDIYSTSLPNVPDLIKNLEKRVIGFMKKRETDFFVPMNKNLLSLNENHIKLFDSLQTFDVLKTATEQYNKKAEKSPFIVSENDTNILNEKEVSKEDEVLKEEVNIVSDNSNDFSLLKEENNVLLGKVNKAEKQRDLFKNELLFLFERISKSGALSGGKFNANINQRDYDRIEKIINDN